MEQETFSHYPYDARLQALGAHSNTYLIIAEDGARRRVDAGSVSEAIKQSGIAKPKLVRRLDPMAQTLIGLDTLGS